jgi:tetratricopeptide (TPR) repeat protein
MMLVFEAQEKALLLSRTKQAYYSGRCNQLLGDVFYSRYIEEEAVVFYLQSLRQYAACSHYSEMAEVLNALTSSFQSLNRQHEALITVEALNRLMNFTKIVYIKALYYETYADFLSETQKLSESKNAYLTALQFYHTLPVAEKMSDTYLNLAICENELGNRQAALSWIDSATIYNTENKYLKNLYEATYYRAEFIGLENPSKGIEIITGVLDQLEELDLNIHRGIYLKLLVFLQKKSALFEAALKSNEQFNHVINNIYGSNVERKIAGLQLEVETGKLNHRIGLLQKEQELATVNARSQRNMLFYFFLAIVVLFTMALNNVRRLQYRLYLLKEFALDFSWIQYFLAFLSSLFYFSILLIFINPFNLTQNASVYPWIHYSVIAFLMSALSVTGVFLLPARWSAKPGFNSRFTITALVFIVLMNAAIIFYSILAGISGNSVYDLLNVVLVLTGITIIPVFYFIIYLEKVLLRKHIQMAGMLSNRIQSFKPGKMEEIVTVYSDRSRDMLEVSVNNLLLVEANGNYSKIVFLENEKMKSTLILISLTKLLEQLAPFSCFSRCHKSYIVNLNKVKKVMGNSHGYKLDIPFVDEPIPVSRSYAADFIRDFNKVFKEGEHRN